MAIREHPENLRVYGVLRRGGLVLISAEYVGEVFCWKFPGGGVKDTETAEAALARELPRGDRARHCDRPAAS